MRGKRAEIANRYSPNSRMKGGNGASAKKFSYLHTCVLGFERLLKVRGGPSWSSEQVGRGTSNQTIRHGVSVSHVPAMKYQALTP